MKETVVKCICNGSYMDNVSNIATVIISLINLIFVICIYFKDKKNKKEEKLKQYKYDWFRMIDVRERVKNLNDLNLVIKQKVDSLYNDKEDSLERRKELMSDILTEIDCNIFSEKDNYTYLLKCIDVNRNAEITKLYNAYQEEYMNILLKAKAREEYDISSLNDLSAEISEKFYAIGIDLIK